MSVFRQRRERPVGGEAAEAGGPAQPPDTGPSETRSQHFTYLGGAEPPRLRKPVLTPF